MSYPIKSLEDFLSFAQSKDPDEWYDYHNIRHCACARYAASRGLTYTEDESSLEMENIAWNDDVRDSWTYGLLVNRIKAAISVRQTVSV